MEDFLTRFVMLEVGLMASLAWTFVARHAWTRWWETAEGRYLMKSKTALALIFTMGLMFRVFEPTDEVRLLISVLLYAWIAYTLAELLILQHRAWRSGRIPPSTD